MPLPIHSFEIDTATISELLAGKASGPGRQILLSDGQAWLILGLFKPSDLGVR